MADPRPAHYTMPPPLMNQPTPPPKTDRAPRRGPQRAHDTGRHEPLSLAEQVDMALDRVKGLGPKQCLALHNELVKMTRDIGFIKLVANSIHGPYSAAAVQDEGKPL